MESCEDELTAITDFPDALRDALPEAWRLLRSANLVVHERVDKVVLSGSRGPAGGYHLRSDMDLSLVVCGRLPDEPEREQLLRDVVRATADNWTGEVDADLVVVFDSRGCGLRCLDTEGLTLGECGSDGINCLGLYKQGKGFSGYVSGITVDVREVHPCVVVWERANTR